MKTCGTCKHWGTPYERQCLGGQDRRCCTAIPQGSEYDKPEDWVRAAAFTTEDGAGAFLMTRSHFGCVLHEEKA